MPNKLKSKIPKFLAKLDKLQMAVDETADVILETAQELAPSPWHPGPWARGALVNSMYVSRAPGSIDNKYTFQSGLTAAMASASIMHASDPARYPMLRIEEIDSAIPPVHARRGVARAIVVDPMYYAGLIEFGGVSDTGNIISPQPYLGPAAKSAMPGLVKRIKVLLK